MSTEKTENRAMFVWRHFHGKRGLPLDEIYYYSISNRLVLGCPLTSWSAAAPTSLNTLQFITYLRLPPGSISAVVLLLTAADFCGPLPLPPHTKSSPWQQQDHQTATFTTATIHLIPTEKCRHEKYQLLGWKLKAGCRSDSAQGHMAGPG